MSRFDGRIVGADTTTQRGLNYNYNINPVIGTSVGRVGVRKDIWPRNDRSKTPQFWKEPSNSCVHGKIDVKHVMIMYQK